MDAVTYLLDNSKYFSTREDGLRLYKCNLSVEERKKSGLKIFMACAICEWKVIILFPEFDIINAMDIRECILQHESAHCHGIMDEGEADKYAIERTSEAAYLRAVEASKQILDMLGLNKKHVRNVLE